MLHIFFERNRRNFQRFSDDTSIHGFKELFYAKSLFWLISWALLMGGAIGVTTYQIYGAIHQFLEQPTVTVIQPANAQDMMYPSLKICYPHWLYWIDWNKAIYESNFTKSSVLFGMSYISDAYSSQKFNVTEAEHDFKLGMKINNITSIKQFYLFVALAPVDMGLNFDNISTEIDSDAFSLRLCHVINGGDINFIIQQQSFFDQQKSSKVRKTSKTNVLSMTIVTKPNLGDVPKYVNEIEYAEYMQQWLLRPTDESYYSLTFTNYSNLYLPTKVYPNAFDKDAGITVSQQYDSVSIAIKLTIHVWKNTPQMPCKVDWKWITMNDTCTEKCLLDYYEAQNNDYMYLAEAIFENRENRASKIRPYEIHFLNVQNGSSTPRPAAVRSTATMNSNSTTKFHKNEGITSKNKIAGNPNVTATKIQTTTKAYTNYTDADIENIEKLYYCFGNCSEMTGCKVYTFDTNVQTILLYRLMGSQSLTSFTPVKIEYPTENDVLVMLEQDAQTWESFVGNVGGLLGIWTGASILSFIQLVYLCCCIDCDNLQMFKIPERVHSKQIKLVSNVDVPVIHTQVVKIESVN